MGRLRSLKPLQPVRVRCSVPGCGRTFKDEEADEVICGAHWRLADKRLRALLTKVRRKARRSGWSTRLLALDNRLWLRGKAQAVERALGI